MYYIMTINQRLIWWAVDLLLCAHCVALAKQWKRGYWNPVQYSIKIYSTSLANFLLPDFKTSKSVRPAFYEFSAPRQEHTKMPKCSISLMALFSDSEHLW